MFGDVVFVNSGFNRVLTFSPVKFDLRYDGVFVKSSMLSVEAIFSINFRS